jgi:hypothetical protein
VDVRISPCASDPVAGRRYGPKAWNLQAGETGIVELLRVADIAYTWLVELGNPQRQDHEMTVLRSHLADRSASWPVHRGLEKLAAMIRAGEDSLALLCACRDGSACHRTVVADALNADHFQDRLRLREVVDA